MSDGALSQNEIDALLAGVDNSNYRQQRQQNKQENLPQISFNKIKKFINKEASAELENNFKQIQGYFNHCCIKLLNNQKALYTKISNLEKENIRLKNLINDIGLPD